MDPPNLYAKRPQSHHADFANGNAFYEYNSWDTKIIEGAGCFFQM
jgi:hypothetical protein